MSRTRTKTRSTSTEPPGAKPTSPEPKNTKPTSPEPTRAELASTLPASDSSPSSGATTTASELEERLRAIPAPRPMLSRDDVHRLTDRQKELLTQLGSLFRDGFADLTMSEIAGRLNCSLRTLYGLAPSRDELVLTVVDTHLWRVGREAMAAITPDMAPLDAIRTYLSAATFAVSGTTEAYSRDLAAMPAARRRNGDHADYVVAVTRTLLDLAVERSDIAPVDTAAVAHTLATVGQEFIRPEVMATLRTPPKDAADTVVDLILRGLATPASDG